RLLRLSRLRLQRLEPTRAQTLSEVRRADGAQRPARPALPRADLRPRRARCLGRPGARPGGGGVSDETPGVGGRRWGVGPGPGGRLSAPSPQSPTPNPQVPAIARSLPGPSGGRARRLAAHARQLPPRLRGVPGVRGSAGNPLPPRGDTRDAPIVARPP